jgi:hypothetical protein
VNFTGQFATRPALVLEVTQRADGVEVKVAYGTSKKLGRLLAGEFAIRKSDHAAAYALAGLSYDTKFNLAETLALPWDSPFFAVPPNPRHGQMPKLGSLHSGMMKVVEAAMRAARSSR